MKESPRKTSSPPDGQADGLLLKGIETLQEGLAAVNAICDHNMAEADRWRLSHAEAIAELQDVGLERNRYYTQIEALRTWAASHHDNGGHDTNRCPACQVLAILEAH